MSKTTPWKKVNKYYSERRKDLSEDYEKPFETACEATAVRDGNRWAIEYVYTPIGAAPKKRQVDEGQETTFTAAKKAASAALKTCKRGQSGRGRFSLYGSLPGQKPR